MSTQSAGQEALEWWMDLTPGAKQNAERWLDAHEPPEGTSGIQHAYDHRAELPFTEDLPEERLVYEIEIEVEGAAFGEQPGQEAGRILEQLAHHCQRWGLDEERALIDINGNRVGTARFTTRTEGE